MSWSRALNNFSLDANADTPIHPEVLKTWVRLEQEAPGNPASLHKEGRRARGVLEEARDRVAEILHSDSKEIIFTSGATEANNLALFGLARGVAKELSAPISIISSEAEHPAVLGPLRMLQQEGFQLKLLPLESDASIAKDSLLPAFSEISHFTLFASQWANNETGAIQPTPSLKDRPIHWHCDAVQGLGKLPLSDAILSANSLVFSGHKIRGPKGIGVLKLSSEAPFAPVFGGGGQQEGVRPGTESPALAGAFAHALELALQDQKAFEKNAWACRKAFLEALGNLKYKLQQRSQNTLANTLSLSFSSIDGRMLLPACDAEGLRVSAGAACSSGAPEPSSVLRATGLSKEEARATIRISFGWDSSPAEAKKAALLLRKIIHRLYEVAIQ